MKLDASLMFGPIKNGEMAAELEAVGYDGVYTFEGKSDPFISLTVAAVRTQRVDLMTSIAVAFARNPMSLAYLGNDLQSVSEGRFVLGLGTQVKAHIERRFDMPWSKPAARMREMVLAIKAIWSSWASGEKLNFQGDFYSNTLSSPMFSPQSMPYGSPKIFLAGVGPKMTEVVGEVGDGYFMHPFNSVKSTVELSRPALERGFAKVGRSWADIEVSAQVVTATGLNEEEMKVAERAARNQIAFYGSTPAYRPILAVHGWEDLQPEANRMTKEGKWDQLADLVDDEILHTFAVVGEPKDVARKILDRFAGTAQRLSPVVYESNTELLKKIQREFRALL